jgi:hypothetical protein
VIGLNRRLKGNKAREKGEERRRKKEGEKRGRKKIGGGYAPSPHLHPIPLHDHHSTFALSPSYPQPVTVSNDSSSLPKGETNV